MIQFTYSFCMAMLHSFWQAALLMLLYIIIDTIINKNCAPLAKRNFLYLTITTQLVLFVCTYSMYYFSNEGNGIVSSTVQHITNALGSQRIKTLTPWIFSLYVFIISCKWVQAVHNWYVFKQQFKNGLQKPGVELKLFTELKAFQFGIKRKVNIWLSQSIQTPLTFGYFKPIILLPVALVNNISPKQAETLILHELTHIRTHDYLLNWFLVAAEAIFFFNPFVTGLCKKIRLEREKHCDLNVISFEYAPALYAETLLQAERIKQLTPVFQVAAVDHKKHLLQRIRFFTSEKTFNQTRRFHIVAPLIALALLFILSTGIIFQSSGSTVTLQTATELNLLPADNYIISKSENSTPFYTDKIQNKQFTKKDKKAKPAFAPLPNKQVSIPEPEIATAVPAELNIAMPITTRDNDAAREIIITEQGSEGTSVKVYSLVFENGKWILQPKLLMSNMEKMTDSLSGKMDALQRKLKKVYPDQQ